jgi:DNA-directed RNA polymerase specialized sigma24 family protein
MMRTSGWSMSKSLVEAVRRKQSQKHGGDRERVMLADADLGVRDGNFDILALNDAIERLAADDPPAARLAELRIFAGLSVDEAAQALGVPHTSAYRQWTYAQAWLRAALDDDR